VRKYAAIFLLFIIAACATQQVQQEETADSTPTRLAYLYVSVAHIRLTTAELLKVRKISVDDARYVQALADSARKAIDQGVESYFAGDVDLASGGADMAKVILEQAQQYRDGKEEVKR
jgi:hypothetical protein